MAEYRVSFADCTAGDWPAPLARILRDAEPGDTVVVRTEPMLRLAQGVTEREGKTGVAIVIADVLDD